VANFKDATRTDLHCAASLHNHLASGGAHLLREAALPLKLSTELCERCFLLLAHFLAHRFAVARRRRLVNQGESAEQADY